MTGEGDEARVCPHDASESSVRKKIKLDQPMACLNNTLAPRLNQPRVQDQLVIAREVVINDAEASLRHKFTQDEHDSVSNHVNIYFKCQGRMYSVAMKAAIEEITLSMLEARICKKVVLDETMVILRLSYVPLLVGCEEQFTISDDEDLCVYLTSTDKENRRCMLYVEVISELPEQLSRAGEGSSLGLNYEEFNSKDDEIGATMKADEYVELPPWEDGVDLTVQQEFPSKRALQDLVSVAACSNGFGFDVKKSDKLRLVLKCHKEGCKWGLRAAKIRRTEIFSIRRYNKMHTCSRDDGQTKNNLRGKITPQIVASLLHEDSPRREMRSVITPKSVIDFVWTKLGVKISYSTAFRGRNLYSSFEDEVTMLMNDASDQAARRVEV